MSAKWTPWLLMAVIFLVGVVTGGALTLGFGPHLFHPRPPGPEQITALWLRHLTQRLNLTADQQSKVEPILAGAGKQLQAVRHEEGERAFQIFEKTNRELATVLTPEQQAELAKMQREMGRDRDRMFPGGGRQRPWGGPGGPPPRDGDRLGAPEGNPPPEGNQRPPAPPVAP